MDLRLIEHQRPALSQQQLQALHILEMDVYQLDSFLSSQALDNPFIEYEPSTHWNYGFASKDSDSWQNMLNMRHNQVTLKDHLMEQLQFSSISCEQCYLVKQLIQRVDDRGYLSINSTQFSAELSISYDEARNALQVLQSFTPIGVGARNLKECLLMQLQRKRTSNILAIRIVRNYLGLLAKQNIRKLAELCDTTEESVQEARKTILQLNPKPGNGFSSNEDISYTPPDLVVQKDEHGHLGIKSISITEFAFRVNKDSAAKMRQCVGDDVDGLEYIRERLQSAQSISSGLQRRGKTLLAFGKILIELQQQFFLEKETYPKPCLMVEIAEALSVHPATVTRLIKNKNLMCERGTLPLAYFFNRSNYLTDNGEVTASFVKAQIAQLISNENPVVPLSDQMIVRELGQKGIDISRRTVTKYREILNILSSYDRKKTG